MTVAAFFGAENLVGPRRRRDEVDVDRLATTRDEFVDVDFFDLESVYAIAGFHDETDALTFRDFDLCRLERKTLRHHLDHSRRGSRGGVLIDRRKRHTEQERHPHHGHRMNLSLSCHTHLQLFAHEQHVCPESRDVELREYTAFDRGDGQGTLRVV